MHTQCALPDLYNTPNSLRALRPAASASSVEQADQRSARMARRESGAPVASAPKPKRTPPTGGARKAQKVAAEEEAKSDYERQRDATRRLNQRKLSELGL